MRLSFRRLHEEPDVDASFDGPEAAVVRPLRGHDERLRPGASHDGNHGVRVGLQARVLVEQRVRDRVAALDEARERLHDAHAAAASDLGVLATFAARGRLDRARLAVEEVEAYHAADGPQDRRQRLAHPGVPIAIAIAAGLFESALFARFLLAAIALENRQPNPLELLTAYTPGVILAVLLWITGRQLGEAIARHKERREARGAGSPRPVWRFAVPLAVALLMVVWFLAAARAAFLAQIQQDRAAAELVVGGDPDEGEALSTGQDGDGFGQRPIVVLLLTVTVGAMAVNAGLHNPWADNADRAQRDLDRAVDHYESMRTSADDAVNETEKAWDNLRGVLVEAREDVEHVAVDRWLRFPPPAPAQPLEAAGNGATELGLPLPPVGDVLAAVGRMADPQPGLGPLWHAERLLVERHPRNLIGHRDALVAQLDGQLVGSHEDARRGVE